MIVIYTDGSCLGNPGRGGAGVFVPENQHTNEIRMGCYGGPMTTNNVMELQAMLMALDLINQGVFPDGIPINIRTDSNYTRLGLTQWRKSWEAQNFKGKKNVSLWKALFRAYDKLPQGVSFSYVKAHDGNEGNDIVDRIAKDAAAGREVG